MSSLWSFAMALTFQHSWEQRAINQGHVLRAVNHAIAMHGIKALVIDYHPSALYLDMPRDDVATILIGLNREGDFHADMVRRGLTHHRGLAGAISVARARAFERRVNRAVDQLVVIGAPDAPPRSRLRAEARCITPWLDPPATPWRHGATQTAFFAGDYNHWPNRLAIDWIVGALAPALLAEGCPARLAIIGANDAAELGRADAPENVAFLGRGDAATTAALFQTADVSLCPVANDYGVKFKALEALAFGTPLLASPQTLAGLPHLAPTPCLQLDRPEEAARTLAALLADPARLQALQADQADRHQRFVASQAGVWGRLIGGVVAAKG